jgi:hypothetical protein
VTKRVIKFFPRSQVSELIDKQPDPARLHIPEWYKNMPGSHATGQEAKWRYTATAKRCTPMMDAFTSGYIVTFPQDIGFAEIQGQQLPQFGFQAQVEGVNLRALEPESPHRVAGLPVPKGYSELPYRVSTTSKVSTPPGYSILVTHPFNRYDLPFLTLTGVVDVDDPGFNGDLTITMYVRKDFEGVIEQGTPLAQIFPFKRENWISEWGTAPSPAEIVKARHQIMGKLIRSYQTQFWKKKSYE